MIAGIFGRTYPFTTAEAVFAAAAADGYRTMQFNLSCLGLASLPAELPEHALDDVPGLVDLHGVTLAALSGTYNMAHPDAGVRAASRAGFASVIRAAVAIGAPLVTLCTGSRDPQNMWHAHPDNGSAGAWRDMRAELDFALNLAAQHGLRLGIEPEPANVIGNAPAARRLLDELGAGAPLGIILDAANLVGEDLPHQHRIMSEAVDLLGDRVVLAHAKDVSATGQVTCPGDGAVDLPAFVRLLSGAGFTGAVIGHGFGPEDSARAAKFLNRLVESI